MHRLLGSLERSMLLLNAITDGITARDKDGQLIFVNDAAARMSGYPSSEAMLAASPSELAARYEVYDEQGHALDFFQLPGYAALSGKPTPERVVRYHNFITGDQRWSAVKAQPVLAEDGEVEFVVTITRDVTAQKKQQILQDFLIEASKTLAASIDYKTTLANIAKLATPKVADWCAVDLVDEQGAIQRVAVTHVDPAKVEWAYEMHRRYPRSMADETSFVKVIKTGQTDYLPKITDELLVLAAKGDTELLRIVRELGFRSSAVVPLTARGNTFGAISLVTTDDSGRYLSPEDVALAEELGRTAALAVDNARLYYQTQNQRERFEVTLRSIGDAVIAANPQGVIELMTPIAESLTGWTQEEAVGKPVNDIFKIVAESVKSALDEQATNRSLEPVKLTYPAHTLLIRRQGQAVPIEHNVSPIKNRAGESAGEVLVFRDISERRRAERERLQLTQLLEAERRRLRNILENVPGMVWEGNILSSSQRLNFVNSFAEKILGYTVEDWLTMPGLGRTIIHPDDLTKFAEQIHSLYRSGRNAMTLQARAITRTGSVLPIETHLTVTPDSVGNPVIAYGLMMDVSQRIEAEDALRQYASDLKRSNEELERFAYIASHDLQEPLRTITSYLQLLEVRYQTIFDQDARDFIAYAIDGAARMKALINDLLAYSRVKTDKRNFVLFNTAEALKAALANLGIKIEESQAQVVYENLPAIVGNKNQFVQLFQNLVANALKFHSEQAPRIRVSAERAGDDWLFSIQDNGIGIESQYLERIFTMFQRLHPIEKYKGSGIGLAVCKKVIEHHQGRIWAESTLGEGATFYFTVPTAPETDKSERQLQ